MEHYPKRQLVKAAYDHKGKEWEKMEKILLTVSSGTLAFSVAFFVSSDKPFSFLVWLKLSWVLLSLSLVSLLLSYAFNEFAAKRIIDRLEAYPSETIPGVHVDEIEDNWLVGLTGFFNYLSIGACVVGMVSLAAFGYLNI